MTAITVNGAPFQASAHTTLADLVSEWCTSSKGIAVAHNGDVVPRSGWSETLLTDGDAIEIVTAAAGG
jgi:sulfur carrier protein